MKRHCKYKVGDEFNTKITKFPEVKASYRVVSVNVKGDSHGSIKLDTISTKEPRKKTKTYKPGERQIIVEDKWFDEKLTGRMTRKR